jgi:hypothetical protein
MPDRALGLSLVGLLARSRVRSTSERRRQRDRPSRDMRPHPDGDYIGSAREPPGALRALAGYEDLPIVPFRVGLHEGVQAPEAHH